MRYRRTITRHPSHKDLWLTRDGKAFVEVKPSRGAESNNYPDLARYGRIHHLMLETFRGLRPQGLFGLHIDDNAQNWHIDNLYWGTHGDNAWDRARNGKQHRRKIAP